MEENDVVFVVGNPGRTSRLTTMAQLEYDRDVNVPAVVNALDERLQAMRAFYEADPVTGEKLGLRNRAFSLSNSLKAYSGRLDALRDPVVMAIRGDIERKFLAAVDADPDLKARFGDVVQEIADIQQQKRELGPRHAAFLLLGSSRGSSVTLTRATLAAEWLAARSAHAPRDTVDAIRTRLLAVGDQPRALEQALLAARLADLRRNLGPDEELTRVALAGATPDAAAAALLDASVFADSARTANALSKNTVPDDDPALRIARVLLPLYADYSVRYAALSARERNLAAALGRARFAIYGTAMPPDGSSSPRITDGLVLPYHYNGTEAPVYTTFYGVYDRFHSFGPNSEW
ncbi:MAG: S46 family peptidase, partial [Gemmatimonadota bacterium]